MRLLAACSPALGCCAARSSAPGDPCLCLRRDKLRTTCTVSHDTYACSEAVVQLSKRVANTSHLAWLPYGCPPLPEPARPAVERCLADR